MDPLNSWTNFRFHWSMWGEANANWSLGKFWYFWREGDCWQSLVKGERGGGGLAQMEWGECCCCLIHSSVICTSLWWTLQKCHYCPIFKIYICRIRHQYILHRPPSSPFATAKQNLTRLIKTLFWQVMSLFHESAVIKSSLKLFNNIVGSKCFLNWIFWDKCQS